MRIDGRLVDSARLGGEGLEPLIATIWPQAYRVAFAILRDRGLAEDAAQEACVAIARALPSLRNSGAFPTWSYKIVVGRALAFARRRPRTQSLDALADSAVRFDTSDALDLYNALASLKPVERGAILLHYYAGLTSGEIAAASSLPPSTVRFRLMRARAALRKALSAVTNTSYDEVLSDVH